MPSTNIVASAWLLVTGWRRTDFRACAESRLPLQFVSAPRETFERAGASRKAGTGSREAIRRGHFFFQRGTTPRRVRLFTETASEDRPSPRETHPLGRAHRPRGLDRHAVPQRGRDACTLHP